MAFVTVPKDLSRVKSKIAFNLTKRQLLCFGAAAAVGIPFYIFTKNSLGTSVSGILMIFIMLPFFFLAMYEKDGLPFEQIFINFIRFCRSEQIRTYQTNNLYRQLEELPDTDAGKEAAIENKKKRKKR
ncbi:PrgI family protein [Merdimonas faecis]|uniref:PrgI family protein n=1 Tax=Merdimonas faecis TaxID=1653435 RepID=UPI0023F824E5|nr:PrgI family protein [Merdimonas faecis]